MPDHINERSVVFLLISLLLFISIPFTYSCRGKDEQKAEVSRLFVKLKPAGGVYPQYSTFYITVETNKEIDVCYTIKEKHNPKPCEREHVFRAKASSEEPLTIPVIPEFAEGATTGVFFLRVYAKAKDGEEAMVFGKYEIILVPFITVTPPGGFFPREITVAVGCNKPCYLYYSTDGSEPKEKVEDGFILDVTNDIVLKVYAEDKAIGIKSETIQYEFFIDRNAPKTNVLGIEDCTCISGCDKEPKEVVRCKKETTVSLVAVDDKSPQSEIFWTTDGIDPSDDLYSLVEAGGNTNKSNDSADIPIRTHTILKFFSKDIAGNKEDIKTAIVLIGDKPFAYAVPAGGIFNKEAVPLKVKLYSIPYDALLSYVVSFPDATTLFSDSCRSPCEITLEKEGRNVIAFRAFKDGLYDDQRRADYIIDLNPPVVSMEPANCFSDSGPISATIKSNEEKVRVFWRICDKELPGCKLDDCGPISPEVISGIAPVTDVIIEIPSFVFYCGVDQAGNKTDIKKSDCEVSGKYEETFVNQDNMDASETDAEWGGGKLTLKRDSIKEEGQIDTQGGGTIDIDVYGKLAIMVDQGSGIKLVDISSTSAPGIISQIRNSRVRSAEMWNDIVFVLTDSTLEAYDISNPRSPKRIGNALLTDLGIVQTSSNQIKVWGKYIIISAGSEGIVIVQISHSQTTSTRSVTFERIGGFGLAGSESNKIDVFGNILAIAEEARGMRLISIEKPSSPVSITSYSEFLVSGEIAISLKMFFPYVAIGTNNGNLYVISISQPAKTEKISEISLGARINHIEAWGKFLIVSDNRGIKFLDVGNPAEPKLLYQVNRGPSTYTLAYGDRILVGDTNSALFIYKIAESFERAYELYVLGRNAYRVSLDGGTAGVARSDEVSLFEVLDPFSPKPLTSIQISSSDDSDPYSYLLWGDKVLIGDDSRLLIYNFLPYENVKMIKELDLSSIRSGVKIREIVAWGDHAVIAGEKAVFMLPLSDISNLSPSSVIKYDVPAYDIDISGDILYVSSREPKVVALRITPNAFSLLLSNLVSTAVYETVPFGKYILTAQNTLGMIMYDVSQIIFGRMAQVGSVAMSQIFGLENFGYYTLAFGGDHTVLIDNSYVDRLREVYSARLKSSQGDIFGAIAIVTDRDGKSKIIRFAREKFTYLLESKAKSKELTPDLKVSIKDAQLTVVSCETQSENCEKVGCSTTFQLSNNGGATWVDIPPNAGFFPFGSTGRSLMWRATLRTGDPFITPEICKIIINYRFGR